MLGPQSLTQFLRDRTGFAFVADAGILPAAILVRAGEPVPRDPSIDGRLHIVHSGLLEVLQEGAERHHLRWIGPGQVEIDGGVCEGSRPRTIVVARRDSVVLALSFDEVNAAMAATTRDFLGLSRQLGLAAPEDRAVRPGPHVLGVIPKGSLGPLADILRAAADRAGFALVEAGEWDDSMEGVIRLDSASAQSSHALWLGTDEDSAWNAAILRSADRLAVIGFEDDASAAPASPTPSSRLGLRVDHLRFATDDAARGGVPPTREAGQARIYRLRPEVTDVKDYLDSYAHEHTNPERLARFDMFANLDRASLQLVQERIEWRTVPGGTRIIRKGEDGDGIYVLDVGRLVASVDDGRGGRRHLADMGPGATVGEIAMLHGRRAADVDARRDCRVGFLSRPSFDELLRTTPSICENLARTLAQRLANPGRGGGNSAPALILMQLLDSSDETQAFVASFLSALQTVLRRSVRSVDAAAVDAMLGAGASRAEIGQLAYGRLIGWLQATEVEHDVVLLVSRPDELPWAAFCAQQADRVMFVASARSSPALRPVERHVSDPVRRIGQRQELVLLQRAGRREGRGTAEWLKERPDALVHHVRARNDADIASTARRVMGCAIGIAFSGGVGFAPAHLGVIRAMAELGLPIDVISGTSSGAGIAGAIAMGLDHAEAFEMALSVVEDLGLSWTELQPPITALTTGDRFNNLVYRNSGDRHIEDMFRPVTFSAVDIANDALVWLDRGVMWEAVRASSSLPIIVPPVSSGGRVLVDGALAAHNPIEPLLHRCERGMLIVSELVGPPRSHLSSMPSYGTRLSGWKLLADRLLPWRTPQPVPTVADILTRSMLLSNTLNAQASNLLRHPAVCHVRSMTEESTGLKVERSMARRLEQKTYESAARHLATWRGSAPHPLFV